MVLSSVSGVFLIEYKYITIRMIKFWPRSRRFFLHQSQGAEGEVFIDFNISTFIITDHVD